MTGRRRVGVYPHGNSGWKIQVKNHKTGKWKQLTATRRRFEALRIPLRNPRAITKTDAYRLKQKYEDLLWQENGLSIERTEFQDAIDDYLKFQQNAQKYLHDKERVLGEFAAIVGDIPLAEITKAHLKEFENHLRDRLLHGKERLKINTIIRYLVYVKSFFNYCYREGWIFRSPFFNYRLPREDSAPEIKPFSLDEVSDIVRFLRGNEPQNREYAVWIIAGFSGLGLRLIELRLLNWEVFDAKERFVHITESKNLESRRPQPVPLSLEPLFLEQRKKSGPMFPAMAGQRISQNQMASLGKKIASQFSGFAWRRFRKTYSTLLQTAGVDSLIIDRLLGHSSRSSAIRVSARHYIGKEYGFYRSLVDKALEPLEEVFWG